MRKFTGLYYSTRNRHGSFTTVQLGNPCSTSKEILHVYFVTRSGNVDGHVPLRHRLLCTHRYLLTYARWHNKRSYRTASVICASLRRLKWIIPFECNLRKERYQFITESRRLLERSWKIFCSSSIIMFQHNNNHKVQAMKHFFLLKKYQWKKASEKAPIPSYVFETYMPFFLCHFLSHLRCEKAWDTQRVCRKIFNALNNMQ